MYRDQAHGITQMKNVKCKMESTRMTRMRQMDTDKIIPLQVGGVGVVEFGAYNRAEQNHHINYFINIELNKLSATNTTQPPPNPSSLEGNWLGARDKKHISVSSVVHLCASVVKTKKEIYNEVNIMKLGAIHAINYLVRECEMKELWGKVRPALIKKEENREKEEEKHREDTDETE